MAKRMSGPRFLAYYSRGTYSSAWGGGPTFLVASPVGLEDQTGDLVKFDEFDACPVGWGRTGKIPNVDLAFGAPGAIPLDGLCLFEWGGWK